MKRIIRLCLLLIIFLCTSCMHNQETCNETADDRTIVLPEPFSEMCAESQIRLAMCLYGEQYSFDVPIDDNASSYLHQAASVLTGFKRLTSAAEFEDDINKKDEDKKNEFIPSPISPITTETPNNDLIHNKFTPTPTPGDEKVFTYLYFQIGKLNRKYDIAYKDIDYLVKEKVAYVINKP